MILIPCSEKDNCTGLVIRDINGPPAHTAASTVLRDSGFSGESGCPLTNWRGTVKKELSVSWLTIQDRGSAALAESDWRCFRGCVIISKSWAPEWFFSRGGQIQGCKKLTKFKSSPSKHRSFSWMHFFSSKKLTTYLFLVVSLKTQIFTVTTNAQNTLQHFQRASALKTFHFFRRGRLCSSAGGGLCYGTMAQWPVQALNRRQWRGSVAQCVYIDVGWIKVEITINGAGLIIFNVVADSGVIEGERRERRPPPNILWGNAVRPNDIRTRGKNDAARNMASWLAEKSLKLSTTDVIF